MRRIILIIEKGSSKHHRSVAIQKYKYDRNTYYNSSQSTLFTEPDDAEEAAIRALNIIGLDFGAVDMGISQGVPKIFEINTAPGLEGTTLEAYANAIWTLLEN